MPAMLWQDSLPLSILRITNIHRFLLKTSIASQNHRSIDSTHQQMSIGKSQKPGRNIQANISLRFSSTTTRIIPNFLKRPI